MILISIIRYCLLGVYVNADGTQSLVLGLPLICQFPMDALCRI
jgi:hypothetical protein